MPFLTYKQTRPWAAAIKEKVLSRTMPPWLADPHYGKFSNDSSLKQSEIDTLSAWVNAGAPKGDPKDMPPPREFVDGWAIPKPDAVIELPTVYQIPASGTIEYQHILIPSPFKTDKWVQFAEARPGDPSHVHHIIAFIREPGNPWLKEAKPGVPFIPRERARRAEAEANSDKKKHQQQDGGFGDFLAGYAPGTLPNIMKPGQAKLVKAGSDLVLQMHYTANGKATTDISRIGIVFATTQPTERVLTLAAANADFAIPPGDSNYKVDSKFTLQDDATLLNFLPHMHFRGKSFEYRVTYPSGEKETLLDVPHYDFNWQLTYELAQPKLLPKGTVIECTAHFDNSANNRFNPDPTKEVHFGEQTWEEMMIGFLDVAVPMNKTAMDLMRPKKSAQPGPSL